MNFYQKLARYRRRMFSMGRKIFIPVVTKLHYKRTVIIHTPKCGGRALNATLKKLRRLGVEWVGHAKYREIRLKAGYRSKALTWVALTREPVGWYRSRLTFLRQHLDSDTPRADYADRYNLDSALAGFGRSNLSEFLQAVENPRSVLPTDPLFWSEAPPEFVQKVDWLESTACGLYTLTLLEHCARRPLSALGSPKKVSKALREIRSDFAFIRNERLSSDAQDILGIPVGDLEEVGVSRSFRKPNDSLDVSGLQRLEALDGEAAGLSGGYSVL